ncbi:DUF732 domain-containing protein [Mycobacterium sp. GA-2829]|uniref:DUF732 domain-containing protein n=1 Tax=Mycobacterium sp. GA-2829 TaxID=1772283 RepID=UPI00073FF049|nr:DUF732 domain-containing protein [Mycobacterium sp. GA-2829]KUI29367.1 hypothetical protein AU194_20975 [Mycobacterium sp. GA-2829]
MTSLRVFAAASLAVGTALAAVPAAHADATAYLVNVTVRPGYNFPDANAALAYGRGICGEIAAGRPFADIVADIKSDFRTTDDYQGTYLVSQAAQELCPESIWQLRELAAHYRGPA